MFASLECSGKRSYRPDNPRGVVHHLREVLRVGRPVASGGIQLHGLSGTECARVTLQRAQEGKESRPDAQADGYNCGDGCAGRRVSELLWIVQTDNDDRNGFAHKLGR